MFQLIRRRIDLLTLLLVFVASAWSLSLPLRSHLGLLGFAQDDFYYYLKTAQNLVNHHLASFDGRTRTNGFQPLYFVLMSAVSLFTQNLHRVFVLLWILDVLSTVVIFLLVREVFRRQMIRPLLSNGLAMMVAMFCVRTISLQMEVTLAMPLGFALLNVGAVPPERYTPKRCAALGLLAALTMLARLDAAFLAALFVLGLWLVRSYRPVFTLRNVGAFLLAAVPLPLVYFAINLAYFHELLPVSGAAKELRTTWIPSAEMLTSFHGMSTMTLAGALVCAVLGWRLRGRLRPEEKVFCFAAILSPFVFYTVEMFLSDWKLWGWYFYHLRFSLAGCLLLVAVVLTRDLAPAQWRSVHRLSGVNWGAQAVYGLALVVLLSTRYQVSAVMLGIQDAALRLQEFEQTHPGNYAMGDRAGMFGYVSRWPVLQAEGLMMDRNYLAHLRAQEDLRTTLSKYGVDYYVIFTEKRHEQTGGCFRAKEPEIAGASVMRMRSEFCEPPVYQFEGLDGAYRVFRLPGNDAGLKIALAGARGGSKSQ